MPVQFAVVCESNADFRTITLLVERVILESESLDWLRDYLKSYPIWAKINDQTPCLLWQDVKEYAKQHNVILHSGHFEGLRGKSDAHAGRKALLVLKHILQDRTIDGVLPVRDDDGDAARRIGLEQARADARSDGRERIVIGVAHRMRECWVLHGFDPKNDGERQHLESVHAELGFDPRTSSHRLADKGVGDIRSAKRVLSVLTESLQEREARCWEVTPLQTLRDRGEETGLADFLDEIAKRLVPAVGASPTRS